jgi:hypothetical protein
LLTAAVAVAETKVAQLQEVATLGPMVVLAEVLAVTTVFVTGLDFLDKETMEPQTKEDVQAAEAAEEEHELLLQMVVLENFGTVITTAVAVVEVLEETPALVELED